MKLNFNQLPEADDVSQNGGVDKGTHTLTIENVVVTTFPSGPGLQMTHRVGETNFKINYDNYPLGTDFGKAKLKALLEAINVIPEGDFDLSIIPPLVKGKKFQVDLDYGKNKDGSVSKYLSIVNIRTFKPVETFTTTTNTEFTYDESNF